jgi:hypothetical protein
METLILLLVLTLLFIGVYRARKQSSEVRKEMIEELSINEDKETVIIDSKVNDWEDHEADVHQKLQPKVETTPIVTPTPVAAPTPKSKKSKGRPKKK